jgi:hypothetical protein
VLASVQRVEAWSRQLYAVALTVAGELDQRGLAARQGVSSTAVLLRHRLSTSAWVGFVSALRAEV